MNEFARAETVNVDLRELRFDVRQQIQIPLQRELRMMAALHQNLRAAERGGFFDLAVKFVERNDVCVRIPFDAVECAELAIHIADVRVIDIAIYDVSDDLVSAPIISSSFGDLPAAIR